MMADNDIIEQADRLIRRHRSFIAHTGTRESIHTPMGIPLEQNDDIPVLTDVVGLLQQPQNIDEMQQSIKAILDDWLGTTLPQRVDAIAVELRSRLIDKMSEEARKTLLPRLLNLLGAPRDHS